MPTLRITRCAKKPYRFTPPFVGQDYALLLFVAANDVAAAERTAICETIVGSGCRYVVCFGERSSTWENDIDLAAVAGGKGSSGFMITSSHEGESPDEVAWFFRSNTSFDEFVAERLGVFVIGNDPATEATFERALTTMA